MPSTKAALSNLFHSSRPGSSADEKRHLTSDASSVASSQDCDARKRSTVPPPRPTRPKAKREKMDVPTLVMPPMRFYN
ncbi:hypothetical protein G6O67_000809 [Ophiocordyceps sinensis]|uniref:Uncharacterized protein n=1 Tax=Ophiocordyceps sinensis TaxID=72228 RepID=A0A8H4PZU8_9HYPO|nr:hypothetical protein G6O67_000809 [Ophiocordyceps sinensis]